LLENLNGRFEIRKALHGKPWREEYLAADMQEEEQPCLLFFYAASERDRAWSDYSLQKNIFCPSLVRPDSFYRVWSGAPGGGWFFTRPFLPGITLEDINSAPPPQAVSDLAESRLYLERHGITCSRFDPSLVLLGSGIDPQIHLLDLPAEGIESATEPWPAMAEDPSTTPLLRRPAAIPLRLHGLTAASESAVGHLCAPSGSAIPRIVVLRGGTPAIASALAQEILSGCERAGRRTIEVRTPAGERMPDAMLQSLPAACGLKADHGADARAAFDLAVSGSPWVAMARLRQARMDQLAEVVDLLERHPGRVAILLRTDMTGQFPWDDRNQVLELNLDLAGGEQVQSLLAGFLASDEVPPGLELAIERYQAQGPVELLSLLRFFTSRRVLTRSGGSWNFSLSRERVFGLSRAGSIPLSALLGLEELDRRVMALLSHLGCAVSTSSLSYVLQEDQTAIGPSLERLSASGLAGKAEEHGFHGWKCTAGVPEELILPPEESATWEDRFTSYVLGNPTAALPELLSAARYCRYEPMALANILYSALMLAREEGELELMAKLAGEMAALPADDLSASQVRSILALVEPSRLQRLEIRAMRPFLRHWTQAFTEPSDTALALARLGEIEFLDRNFAEAEKLMEQATILCTSTGICEYAPSILSAAVRVSSAGGTISSLAARIREPMSALPQETRPETRIELLSWGSVALALAGRPAEAFQLLQEASLFLPLAGPAAQQTYNWCRGRAHMASGELGQAASFLDRALLLAENRSDHLAVAEILSSLVLCQERLPGYTIRKMLESLELVAERAAAAGNSSYRAFALSRLAGLSVRSLQFGRALHFFEEYARSGRDPEASESLFVAWYRTFMSYLTGEQYEDPGADVFLPGTTALLASVSAGEEPSEAAARVVEALKTSTSPDLVPAGLYLALECMSRGFTTSARSIATVLAESYRPHMDEVIPAWRLCINGLLSLRSSESEKALWTAQQVSRQLDRLLLAWLILQTRLGLDMAPSPARDASIRVLLEELDRFIEQDLPPARRGLFSAQKAVSGRREALSVLCRGREAGPLEVMRDAAREAVQDSVESLMGLETVREDLGVRSDVIWGMEVLNGFAQASRVSILKIQGGKPSALSTGFGRDLPPSPEMLDAARKCEGRHYLNDNFGKTPFGSRFLHVVPLGRSSSSQQPADRRSQQIESGGDGQFLVVEVDLPFNTLFRGRASILMCFARQIAASLAYQELERQTHHDSLTGATISTVWLARLKDELASGKVTREKPLAVLMMDLDFFKSVNDGFGHREGDRVLKAFVDSVLGSIRPRDVIGRLGGEEFGVILPGASEKNAMTIAERIRRKVGTSVFRPDRRPVTVSVGVAVAPMHGEAAELLLRRSDIALYESKNTGRDRVTMWSPGMASTFAERSAVSLLDTGDPGWDHHISHSVLRLATAADAGPMIVADEIRNALRCEFFQLETASGETVSYGPSEVPRSLRDSEGGPPGKPVESMSQDWKYYSLSVALAGGGRMIAAWRASESLPKSLTPLFRAFAGLADSLLGRPDREETPAAEPVS
jgi:diguanylate cyclase (GGDEF)-like protein